MSEGCQLAPWIQAPSGGPAWYIVMAWASPSDLGSFLGTQNVYCGLLVSEHPRDNGDLVPYTAAVNLRTLMLVGFVPGI